MNGLKEDGVAPRSIGSAIGSVSPNGGNVEEVVEYKGIDTGPLTRPLP